MGRAPLVIIATAAGLVGVLSFHAGAPNSILATTRQTASSRKQPQSGSAASASSSGATSSILLITRSAVGAKEQYGYGVLAVRVTVRGSRIESITLAGLQTAEQYSQQLAAQVIPMLRSEVLSAQSAQINGISGASYTSQAYARSVQSALDRLHVA
jgi:uncharacterized protein with FMN-binding domain